MGRTEFFVRNSVEFANRIRREIVDSRDVTVSFDVVSLFTRVPLNDAVQCISGPLALDDSLEERTSIPAHDICQMVELCMKATTYFHSKNQFLNKQMEQPWALLCHQLWPTSIWKVSRKVHLVRQRFLRKFNLDMCTTHLSYGHTL